MAVVAEGMVGIYNVFVEPSMRGRGFGTRMTLEAIEAGRSRGAGTAQLGASDEVAGLYVRLGFQRLMTYVVLEPESEP
jgi:ribosomal protein S18 acetylase RimI-like enzyme